MARGAQDKKAKARPQGAGRTNFIIMTKRTNPFVSWELRRIPFNVVLIIGGEISSFLIYWLADIGPTEEAISFTAAIGYLFLANLVYTGAWLTELSHRRTNQRRQVLFRRMIYVTVGILFISPVLNFFYTIFDYLVS